MNALSVEPPVRLEDLLVTHLQPIRGFALASALYHLFNTGVAEALLAPQRASISSLAEQFDLHRARLEGLLLYLQAEGYLRLAGEWVQPTPKLSEARTAWPWYEMLIGGYAQTFLDLGEGLRASSGRLERNDAQVGSGSCKISHYDAIPLTKSLLHHLDAPPQKVVDLGCGNALYLEELGAQFPGLTAIGVEPNLQNHLRSSQALATPGCRVRLYNMTAQDFADSAHERDADVLIIAFVLQEILGQDGRQGALNFLRKVISRFPDAHLVIIEVDRKADDVSAMQHPLALSYYNPYFLVHYFTDQVIESVDFWLALFDEAGLRLVARATPSPDVDSTDFEVGFLLTAR